MQTLKQKLAAKAAEKDYRATDRAARFFNSAREGMDDRAWRLFNFAVVAFGRTVPNEWPIEMRQEISRAEEAARLAPVSDLPSVSR